MGEPHKHAEVIKAWADGAEVQVYLEDSGTWVDLNETIYWHEVLKYRIKPEPPKYPQTMMTDAELQYKMPVCTHEFTGYVRRVANAAIARAIEDGDVVPAAMLEKVAEAACYATYNAVRSVNYNVAYGDLKLDLAAIIASVKEGKL